MNFNKAVSKVNDKGRWKSKWNQGVVIVLKGSICL